MVGAGDRILLLHIAFGSVELGVAGSHRGVWHFGLASSTVQGGSMCHFALPLLEWTGVPHSILPLLEWTGVPHFTLPLLEWTGVPHFTPPLLEWTGVPHSSLPLLEWTGVPHFVLPLLRWTGVPHFHRKMQPTYLKMEPSLAAVVQILTQIGPNLFRLDRLGLK